MIKKSFSAYDLTLTVISLVSFLLDIISDIFIVTVFYLDGQEVWGSISLAFIAFSTIVMLLISFRWHVTDRTLTLGNFLPHVFFLAPIHRYYKVLKLGWKSMKTKHKDDFDDVLKANIDVAMLRLVQGFTESIPQLCFQLFIILKFNHFNWLIGVSTVFSLTSVAWSLTVYSDALRMAYKENYQRLWTGITASLVWQSWMIISRVMAMVVFSLVFGVWIFLGVGVHWLFMTFWITLQNPDYGETACEKRFFNSVSGFIYIFCFLNLKEGPSRSRMAAFYCFVLSENALMMLLWFIYQPDGTPLWLEITTVSVVFGGFVLGGILMIFYYCCCHPTSRTVKDKRDLAAYWFKRASSLPDREREIIFDNSVARVADWLNASVSLSTDMDSGFRNSDESRSLNLSMPDILKNGTFFGKIITPQSDKSLNTSRKSSGRRSKNRNAEWNGTINSTRSSHLSGSSSRPLLRGNHSPSVSYISNSRDTFSFSNQLAFDRDRSGSLASMSASERAFAVTGLNSSSQSNKATNEKANTTEDSFYASPEFKSMPQEISPLDPKKLWDESQTRLNNQANHIIEIITKTNLKRRTSESKVTWKKLDYSTNSHDYRPKYFNSVETSGLESEPYTRRDNSSAVDGVQNRNKNFDEIESEQNPFESFVKSASMSEKSKVEDENPYESFVKNSNSLVENNVSRNTIHKSINSVSDEDVFESSNKENVTPMMPITQLHHPRRLSEEYYSQNASQQATDDYSSIDEGTQQLSNFFGDISSFHVTSPEVGTYYMSSGSESKLDSIAEERPENDSIQSWTRKTLARFKHQFEDNSSNTEYSPSDLTQSLTSSYVEGDNSTNGYSLSSYSTGRSRSETQIPEQSSSSHIPEVTTSYGRDSSFLTTSDLGETSGSISGTSNRQGTRNPSTDKSTDDSGYSVAKSQSLQCLNNEEVHNSLTFVTNLGSDSNFVTKLGSDSDFPDAFNRTNSVQRLNKTNSNTFNRTSLTSFNRTNSDTLEVTSSSNNIERFGRGLCDDRTPRCLPGLSYLMSPNLTEVDQMSDNIPDTPKSVRFRDQTPVKSILKPVESMTPVKVGSMDKSPIRPGKIVREDLTPVKLEQFSNSPSRPGKSLLKSKSALEKPQSNNMVDKPSSKQTHSHVQAPINSQESSLEITEIDDSPHRLGRSIDLFDRERYRSSVASDTESDIFVKSTDTVVRDLDNSPYKYKSNKHSHDEDKENMGQGGTYEMTSNKYQIPIHDQLILKSRSVASSVLGKQQLYGGKSNDFTHIKPRTIVDDFKKRHVSRNVQKKMAAFENDLSLRQTEAMTNPCYAYSDTESEAEVSRRSANKDRLGKSLHSNSPAEIYNKKTENISVHRRSGHFQTPVTSAEGKRPVFKRLDNTPGFSPVLSAGDREMLQLSHNADNSLPVKPVVSTPKNIQFKSGLKSFDESPSIPYV